ncbi:profilin chickadee [Oratosquilla oratoria]|uniref:profilin chickadee n=1 Tax=Oratosquilla oratoria TaxID=337810 RepID=UPI003F75D24F
MSWDDYVKQQLLGTKQVTKAAILGHDGTVWAKSDNWDIYPEDSQRIVDGFKDNDKLIQSGVTIGGDKYIYLGGSDDLIRCKKGGDGIHIIKTNKAIVIGLYEAPLVHTQCSCVVEKLCSYLKDNGY